jgi:hypothetical protein
MFKIKYNTNNIIKIFITTFTNPLYQHNNLFKNIKFFNLKYYNVTK